jgi:hypothetical protein
MPLKATPNCPPKAWATRYLSSFGVCAKAKLYIGVDEDDLLWETSHRKEAKALLDFEEVACTHAPGAVCAIWDALARRAVADGCDGLLVLFGDDVTYHGAPSWLDAAWSSMDRLSLFQPVDSFDASCCTFPIVSAKHVDVFGALLPSSFVNQGGDPFLKEVYRRIGSVVYDTPKGRVVVDNARGGPVKGWPGLEERPSPLYKKALVATKDVDLQLDDWSSKLARASGRAVAPTVDVVIPSYRCNLDVLSHLCSRCSEDGANVILQIDNPNATDLPGVLALESTDVRIRVNAQNMGASATRNRGAAESLASIIVFLDDDVLPGPGAVKAHADLLLAREKTDCPLCGSAGRVLFPLSEDVWHEATRLSQILTAFDWPVNVFPNQTVPWSVTANMSVWRTSLVSLDEDYARTGGGEDVDVCLRTCDAVGRPFGHCTSSMVEHPFWPRRSGLLGLVEYLGHFWRWTQGDGLLLDRFPQHRYLNLPNVVELTAPVAILVGMRAVLLLWCVELVLEASDALRGPHSRHLSAPKRLCAALLSGVVKNVVDAGHLYYWLSRGRLGMLCVRFDWFAGVTNDVPNGERFKFVVRTLVWISVLVLA